MGSDTLHAASGNNLILRPGSSSQLLLKEEGGATVFSIDTDGNTNVLENVFLSSGKGIYFDGNTGSANFMSDYEEGTWTPTHGVFGFSSAAGHYTKIGNLVTFSGLVVFNNTATSDAVWGGLPFNEGVGGFECGGNATWSNLDINTGTTLYPRITNSNSTFTFYAASDNAGFNNTLTSASGDRLAFFGFYYT